MIGEYEFRRTHRIGYGHTKERKQQPRCQQKCCSLQSYFPGMNLVDLVNAKKFIKLWNAFLRL